MMRINLISLVLIVTGLFAGGCERKADGPSASAKVSKPNVLLVTLDTTRADRLGCYGHQKAATPALDAIAGRGTLFEQALAQVPITLPSHCSMMTGLYPREHGVRDNGFNALGESHTTMASLFKDHGYRTGAFVASFVVDSRFGLDRGFEVYNDDMGIRPVESQPFDWELPANVVTDRALPWLESVKEEPFFAWVHYFDPHHPYAPPLRFKEVVDNPYDGELAFVDEEVKRLTEWLDSAGLTEKTLVVVVGDHGESFGEHGEEGHSVFLYETNLHVPMIFAYPKVVPAGKRVAEIVEVVDVFPTVVELLGWEKPSNVSARSLAGVFAGTAIEDAESYAETHYSYNSYGWAEQRSLTTARWKYISTTKPELYDRQADRGETKNLVSERAEVASGMREALQSRYASMAAAEAPSAAIDQTALKALESLGYTGANVPTVPAEFLTEGLADPKDMFERKTILRYEMAKEIMHSREADRFPLALPLLTGLVEDSPQSAVFHYMLGSCYLNVGEIDAAIVALDAVLAIRPKYATALAAKGTALAEAGMLEEAVKHHEAALALEDFHPHIYINYATALHRLGRTDEAIRQCQKALDLTIDYVDAHFQLGIMLADAGRLPEAIRNYQEAVRLRPDEPKIRYNLGVAYYRVRQYDKAVEQLREVVRINPKHGDALLNLGTTLAGQGAAGEAEEVLLKATEISEVAASAHYNLAAIVTVAGRPDDAIKHLEKAVALKPDYVAAVQQLSGMYLTKRRVADAIGVLRAGVAKVPDNVDMASMLATLLATCNDDSLRNGAAAVSLAERVARMTGRKHPGVLATLAAAYAEAGSFDKAVETARQAVELAEEAKQEQLVTMIRSQLEGYSAGRPYRNPNF